MGEQVLSVGFTPGPWVELETESSVDAYGITGYQDIGPEDGQTVAIVLGYTPYAVEDHQQAADAALIMAAPDLYAALSEILGLSMSMFTTKDAYLAEINRIASAALVKARPKQD